MNLCEDLQKVPINHLRNLLGEKIGTQVSFGNYGLIYSYLCVLAGFLLYFFQEYCST